MKKTILIFSVTGFVLSMVIVFAVFRMCVNCNTGMNVSNHVLKPFVTTPFSANNGQWSEYVLFGAKTSHGMFYLTRNGEMLYTSIKRNEEAVIYSEKIEGFNPINVKPADTAVTKISYFDSHACNLTRGICYHTLKAGEVCKGISMELKIRNGLIEKYFYIEPGANLSELVITTNGAKIIKIDREVITAVLDGGSFTSGKLSAWQNNSRGRVPVIAEYQVKGSSYSFICNKYSKADTLIIDPVISSSFLGGSYLDEAVKTIQLPDGSLVVAGTTCSPDMPIAAGGYDSLLFSPGGVIRAVYIARLDQQLNSLISATFIQSKQASGSYPADIQFFDSSFFITGRATGPFPVTQGAYDTSLINIKTFVTRINYNLTDIIASTVIGPGCSGGADCLMIKNNKVYISGTAGPNFPMTSNVFDTVCNGEVDIFISVFNFSLTNLLYSTYFGGNRQEGPLSLLITDKLFINGTTNSSDFRFTFYPVQDSDYNAANDVCNFIAVIDTSLSAINASFFLGKSFCNGLNGWGTDIDTMNQKIYIGGTCSNSLIFNAPGAYENPFINHFDQGFIASFSNQMQLLNFTFVPARITDICCMNNKVYFTGINFDSVFPVATGGLMMTPDIDSYDIVTGRFSDNLMNYERSARFGGSQFERAENIASCQSGVIICGYTLSDNFPVTPGVIGPQFIPGMHLDQGDMFITILDTNLSDNIRAIYTSCGKNGHIVPNGIIELTDTSTITFYFFPDSGYRVKAVIADEVNVGSPLQYTFNQVFEDHFLHVEFDSATLVRFLQNKTEPYCFPNPSSQNTRFIFSFKPDCKQLNVFNLSGNRIATLEGTPVNNEIHFQWNCINVIPGIYIAVYGCNNTKELIEFVVK